MPAEFERRRKFSAKDHIGSSTPITALSRKVREKGDTWSRLVMSLSLLQAGETTSSVEYTMCKDQKLGKSTLPIVEMSLEDLLSEEDNFHYD